jgi:pimeloyl-ACP methyl ester carboxylesterase
LKWSAHCLQFVDPEVFTPLIEGRWLHGYDRQRVFRSIQCPTLLLQADPSSGGALSDGDAFEMASIITQCTHVSLAGKGHQLHRDHPEAFLSAINEFKAQNWS